jgi:hypothetical protein
MRKSFSGEYRFEKSKDKRNYQVILAAAPGSTITYTDENLPDLPVVEGVTWIASFLVEGAGPDYSLAVNGDLPTGKTRFVVYCRVNGAWTEKTKGRDGMWMLPPGDPAVGVR